MAEKRLWEQLRNSSLGHKFVRQHPIAPYVADFACRTLKLVVEVDGATHSTDEELQRDRQRTAFMAQQGYTVFRTTNDEVLNGMDGVLTLIGEALEKLK